MYKRIYRDKVILLIMLSVGDSSQGDISESVKSYPNFMEDTSMPKKEGSSNYSASLPGKEDYQILIYGQLVMAEEIWEMLKRNKIGAKLYSSDGETNVQTLLGERKYDLFIYHASKRENYKKIGSGEMPPSLEAVLLSYGVFCAYPDETIQKCRDEFERKLVERLGK